LGVQSTLRTLASWQAHGSPIPRPLVVALVAALVMLFAASVSIALAAATDPSFADHLMMLINPGDGCGGG
jgi:hypothetical protein